MNFVCSSGDIETALMRTDEYRPFARLFWAHLDGVELEFPARVDE